MIATAPALPMFIEIAEECEKVRLCPFLIIPVKIVAPVTSLTASQVDPDTADTTTAADAGAVEVAGLIGLAWEEASAVDWLELL